MNNSTTKKRNWCGFIFEWIRSDKGIDLGMTHSSDSPRRMSEKAKVASVKRKVTIFDTCRSITCIVHTYVYKMRLTESESQVVSFLVDLNTEICAV